MHRSDYYVGLAFVVMALAIQSHTMFQAVLTSVLALVLAWAGWNAHRQQVREATRNHRDSK